MMLGPKAQAWLYHVSTKYLFLPNSQAQARGPERKMYRRIDMLQSNPYNLNPFGETKQKKLYIPN